MADTMIMLEAEVDGCAVEIYINNIPFTILDENSGVAVGAPVPEYLVDGENELAMAINPGNIPTQAFADTELLFRVARRLAPGIESQSILDSLRPEFARNGIFLTAEADISRMEESGLWIIADQETYQVRQEDILAVYRERRMVASGAQAFAKLMRYPIGAVLGDSSGVEVLSVEWSGREDEEPERFAQVVRNSADLGSMFGTWDWESASQLELNDQELEEINEVILTVHQCLDAGDPEPAIQLASIRLNDINRVYSLAPDDRQNEFRQVIGYLSALDTWGMESLDSGQYDLRLCANGRMVECIAKDWEPIIRGRPDEEEGQFLFPMMLSKVDGRMQIVR